MDPEKSMSDYFGVASVLTISRHFCIKIHLDKPDKDYSNFIHMIYQIKTKSN